MTTGIVLDGKGLTLDVLQGFVSTAAEVSVASTVTKGLERVRAFVERKLTSDEPFYGINTGFGILANERIENDELEKLQENLILSHAVGVGEPFDEVTSRLIMLLRANVLAMAYSGVRPETLDLLIACINRGITPIIPRQGSVSASGDLAPLAHIALALIGRGEVLYCGKRVPAKEALAAEKLQPIRLSAKEGIALINGTQATAAVAALVCLKAENLIKVADISGALSVEGDRASQRPFDERIHLLRPHPGQGVTASNMRRMIEGSEIIADHSECTRVQDPYSFRCIPQVHGAVKDAMAHVSAVVERELVSCTDNPLLFDADDDILSGGNFHAEPLALAVDAAANALAELGSISERRIAVLNAPLQGELPKKGLVANPGLNSGMMPAHVTMAALVSENKTLAYPASVDTIPTFGGQEDHVSMGLIGARKAHAIAENVEKILAIELIAACQAIELGSPGKKPGKGTAAAYNVIRQHVPSIDCDREFQQDIKRSIDVVQNGSLIRAVETEIGTISI